MYLTHNTNLYALKSILKDDYLKSYSILKKFKKDFKPNEGSGLYTENNFVYFSCVDKLFDKKICSAVTLYFNSKLLFNKSFYVSTMHSPYPNKLEEWFQANDHGEKIKQYKRKYNKYYTKYNTVLKKLYDYSISVLPNGEAFEVFQQIAVRNKVSLQELVAIEFKKEFINDSIINYIGKYYPNVQINII